MTGKLVRGVMKYKELDDRDMKQWYIYVTTVTVGTEYSQATYGYNLYHFEEDGVEVKIISGVADCKAKVMTINPTNPRKPMEVRGISMLESVSMNG